jgi:hypothetical protein
LPLPHKILLQDLPFDHGCKKQTRQESLLPIHYEATPQCTKTTNFRYFHLRHLMKILVLIRTYHKTYWNLLELIFTYSYLFWLIFWDFQRLRIDNAKDVSL